MKGLVGKSLLAGLAALALTLGTYSVTAQDAGQGGRGQRGQRGQRGNFDPAQMQQRMEEMRERMLERYNEELGASEAEWKVIKPLIADVTEKQRDTRGGGRGFGGFGGRRGGRGGPGGPDGGEVDTSQMSPIQKASYELRQILDNENASAADIKAKLAALRSARKKAEDDLKASQEKLRAVLTTRQEAVMVVNGLLD